MAYVINKTVELIGKMAIDGNIIPNQWYQHLKNESGKIHSIAIFVLAEIVYWYRPVPIYDIISGELKEFRKKFKEELLQLGYRHFKTRFGFTEWQVRNAFNFLEDKGLIFRELRDVVFENHLLHNVLHIGIYPEKILEISGTSDNSILSISANNQAAAQKEDEKIQNQQISSASLYPKFKEKDWAAKFTNEQKNFLDYLLNIKPETGDSINKNTATWWIKSFGMEKIQIALQVYWQRVEKAKKDQDVPMPQNISKYVRYALNNDIAPIQSAVEQLPNQKADTACCLEKSNHVIEENKPHGVEKHTTYTEISMMSMNVNEVNDSASVTFQKEEEQGKTQNEQAIKEKRSKINSPQTRTKTSSYNHQDAYNQHFKKSNQEPDWKITFTSEEKKFLAFLLSIIPAIGAKIEEKHATWWIKQFGIDKIKIALQVYWQQVEKAKKDPKVPLPISIGAYVREALNKGTQPCRETDRRNKAFAEEFKRQMNWSELKIKEKYCRAEDIGKEWHYNLPEAIFVESMKRTYENYCSLAERQSCVA